MMEKMFVGRKPDPNSDNPLCESADHKMVRNEKCEERRTGKAKRVDRIECKFEVAKKYLITVQHLQMASSRNLFEAIRSEETDDGTAEFNKNSLLFGSRSRMTGDFHEQHFETLIGSGKSKLNKSLWRWNLPELVNKIRWPTLRSSETRATEEDDL